jgi:hypothetical protein
VGEDRDEVACAADQRFEFLAAGRRRVRLVGCSQVALGFRLFGLHLGCPLRDYGRVGAGFQRGSVAGEDLLAVGERASAALDLGGCGVVAVGGGERGDGSVQVCRVEQAREPGVQVR